MKNFFENIGKRIKKSDIEKIVQGREVPSSEELFAKLKEMGVTNTQMEKLEQELEESSLPDETKETVHQAFNKWWEDFNDVDMGSAGPKMSDQFYGGEKDLEE